MFFLSCAKREMESGEGGGESDRNFDGKIRKFNFANVFSEL